MELDPAAGGASPPAARTSGIDLDLVEYLVVAVPDLTRVPEIADALRALATAEQIAVLDLVAVTTSLEGEATATEPDDVAGLAALGPIAGGTRLLSDDDVAMVGSALPPGASALVVVVEDRWARLLSEAARAAGGRVVGGERIPHRRVADSVAVSTTLLAAEDEQDQGADDEG